MNFTRKSRNGFDGMPNILIKTQHNTIYIDGKVFIDFQQQNVQQFQLLWVSDAV